MTRFQYALVVMSCVAAATLGCLLTWAAADPSTGMHERFTREDTDVPDAILRLRKMKSDLYTQLPATGIDDPFHGWVTIGLAVGGACLASIAGAPSNAMRRKATRWMFNTCTALCGAAFFVAFWDAGNSVFDARAGRGLGLFLTLGALAAACVAAAFAVNAREAASPKGDAAQDVE